MDVQQYYNKLLNFVILLILTICILMGKMLGNVFSNRHMNDEMGMGMV